MDIASLTGSNGATSFANSNNELAGDFDQFLLLLTTQLKHQDPTAPMDVSEFTNQLVQFANVEQSMKSNTIAEKALEAQLVSNAVSMVGYVGKTIEATGDQLVVNNGSAQFAYTLNNAADQVFVTIKDSTGNIVRQYEESAVAGDHKIAWDGTDNNGVQLPDGVYTLAVTAQDASNNKVSVDQTVFGRVTGITGLGGDTHFNMGPAEVALEQLVSVQE